MTCVVYGTQFVSLRDIILLAVEPLNLGRNHCLLGGLGGKVHVATLKHSGEKVAVKVQHEGLRTASRGDILTVKMLIDLAHKLFPNFDYRWLAEETAENLPKELDFEMEGE